MEISNDLVVFDSSLLLFFLLILTNILIVKNFIGFSSPAAYRLSFTISLTFLFGATQLLLMFVAINISNYVAYAMQNSLLRSWVYMCLLIIAAYIGSTFWISIFRKTQNTSKDS